ncbi:MAG: HAMP domain-containing sensor histidine kinase [Planctomycetota bacterium]
MLALLALASGAGLVAMVGWSLVQTSRHDRNRAELDARTAARDLALALRAALRTPAVLTLVAESRHFAVHGGQVQIDPEVGWLHTRAATSIDAVVAERLRQAQVAEFVHGGGAAAHFDELLGPMGPTGTALLPIVTAAAWQAQRGGAVEREARFAERLDHSLTELLPAANADPTVAHVVASAALLAAAAGRNMPTWVARLLPALPAKLATPTLDRLAERGADVVALRAQCEQVAARRDLLTTVAANLQPTAYATTIACGDELLLWFPDSTNPNDGQGALAPKPLLDTLRGLGTSRPSPSPDLPPVPERGNVVFAHPQGDAEPVVPQLAWVTAARVPDPPWFAQPGAVTAAALALVLVFAASVFFTMRGQRREALAMRARAEFLTGVTHELKTPVASIRLVADVLTFDDVPPPKQREYFALLAGESARLSMLIENVLDLGQMERGERAYDLRHGDLAEVARDAVALFQPLAQRDGMALELHEGSSAAVATIDRGALMQAVLNVLENARKYAARGQRLVVATSRSDPAIGNTSTGIFTITVRDFGPGVPAAEREAIFARFARGQPHRYGSIPGVGLGLYLARTIVQRHGGELLCVPPAEGPGAQFVFRLPLAAEAMA